LKANGNVYVIHCSPSRYNRIELSNRLERMVVHVRDPRQAMISWCFFLPHVIRDLDPVHGLHLGVPKQYLDWELASQIDWQIDNYLPLQIDWIVGWVAAGEDPEFKTEILFMTHEELKENQRLYFEKLLKFYQIDPSLFDFPEPLKLGLQNFRKGETDEWRSILSAEQIEKASTRIPEKLYRRFNWPRR